MLSAESCRCESVLAVPLKDSFQRFCTGYAFEFVSLLGRISSGNPSSVAVCSSFSQFGRDKNFLGEINDKGQVLADDDSWLGTINEESLHFHDSEGCTFWFRVAEIVPF